MPKSKHSLEQIETAIQVLADMPPEARAKFINEVDQLKGLTSDELNQRLSKKGIGGGQLAVTRAY